MTKAQIRETIATVCRSNGCKVLRPRVVFSKRMTRNLGCSVEMAHYVSSHLYGEAEAVRVNAGHDARWEQIMRRAGFKPDHQFYPEWYLKSVNMPRTVQPKRSLLARFRAWLFGG